MNRIDEIISQMTVEEKIKQLVSFSYNKIYNLRTHEIREEAPELLKEGVGHFGRIGGSNDNYPEDVAKAVNNIQKAVIENSRFGIPAIFTTEATSGVLGRGFTLFPGNLNIGAAFDEEINYKIANAMREELCAVGERLVLAPVVDVVRDYRYGRFEEAYSEDVYLASQNGIEYIKGMETSDLKGGVGTTLKHYAAQGISDGGRNCAPIHLAERELLEEYVAPFEACIKETNPATIMAAYHELDGVPCHASKYLLKDILRDKIGYEGIVMSDGNGIRLIKDYHEFVKDYKKAAEVGFKAGIEYELGAIYYDDGKELFGNEIPMEDLDDAVRKTLKLKEALGLFENPYVDEEKVKAIVSQASHLQISLDAARASCVLLKNEDKLLPIVKNTYNKIAVVGPLAHRKEYAYSCYSYPTHIKEMYYNVKGLTEKEVVARSLFNNAKNSEYEDLLHPMKTVFEAIRDEYSETNVVYSQGLKDTFNYSGEENFSDFEKLTSDCSDADLIIAVMGDTSGMGYVTDTGESVDRVEITLSKEQRDMLKVLKETGKKILLILANGRPMELSYETEICDGILEVFRLGQMGSQAIVDIITGRYNPSGKLPVTIPKHAGQTPMYYSQRLTGRKQFWHNRYLEMDVNPLYPFGFGLSYTDFAYSDEKFEFTDKGINVNFTIKNIGDCDGAEVAQIYVSKKYCSVAQPLMELKSYKKVHIKKGESAKLSAFIAYESLGYYNIDMDFVLENCEMTVSVGASCEDIKFFCTKEIKFENNLLNIKHKVFKNTTQIV